MNTLDISEVLTFAFSPRGYMLIRISPLSSFHARKPANAYFENVAPLVRIFHNLIAVSSPCPFIRPRTSLQVRLCILDKPSREAPQAFEAFWCPTLFYCAAKVWRAGACTTRDIALCPFSRNQLDLRPTRPQHKPPNTAIRTVTRLLTQPWRSTWKNSSSS